MEIHPAQPEQLQSDIFENRSTGKDLIFAHILVNP
jgi:hypothetical protein